MRVGTTEDAAVPGGGKRAEGPARLLPLWLACIVLVPLAAMLAVMWAARAQPPASLLHLASVTALVAGLALALSALEIARFTVRPDPTLLIVAAALGAAGLTWAESLLLLPAPGGGAWQGGTLWSSWAAQLTLPAAVLAGCALLPEGGARPGRAAVRFVAACALLTGLALSLAWWAPGSPLTAPGRTMRHPLALWPAMLGALALLAWLRRSDAAGSPLGQGMGIALYVGIVVEMLLGPFVTGAAGTFHLAETVGELGAVLAVGCGVIANIAAQTRLAARQLEQLGEEVGQRERAERALALEAARLQRSNESLGQFAYVASHDLQEPLRMISSYLQLIDRRYRDALDDDGREFIAFAVDGAVRMKRLINDLLVFSRVGTKGREPAPTPAGDVFAATLKDLEVAVAEAGAEVTSDPLPTVWVDGRQLGQLLQNLIGNAIKFRRPDVAPQVHVSAERDAEGWRFSVHDNGIGIEPRFAERVFGIFQRLHGGSTYAGSGIGLAVARKIVERHGGRIWVDTTASEGTRVVWTLPYREAADAPDERDDSDADPALRAHVRSLIERAGEVL
ncbi:MAG TPA: ATP-binding protein [Trueperaceae bacterium]|nr:ATP-binding protein [Trueperaceae bacterium]